MDNNDLGQQLKDERNDEINYLEKRIWEDKNKHLSDTYKELEGLVESQHKTLEISNTNLKNTMNRIAKEKLDWENQKIKENKELDDKKLEINGILKKEVDLTIKEHNLNEKETALNLREKSMIEKENGFKEREDKLDKLKISLDSQNNKINEAEDNNKIKFNGLKQKLINEITDWQYGR